MQVLANYLANNTSFKPVLIFSAEQPETIQAKLSTINADIVQAPAYLHQENGWTFDFIADRQKETGHSIVTVFDQKDISSGFTGRFNALGLTVCLDDEKYRSFDCDILVNPNPWSVRSQYQITSPERTEIIAGEGCHFVDLQYINQRELERYSALHPHILLTMGGEDPLNHTSWILQSCAEVLADVQVDVVIGPSHPDARQVEVDAKQKVPHAILHYSPPDLKRLVAGASCAITAGGQTCYELLASGVPSIGIVVEEHQRSLVDFFVGEGALLYGGDHSFTGADTLCDTMRSLLESQDVWHGLREAGYRCFPDDGIKLLLDAIKRKVGAA
ncbi:hypothetical protein [Thalassospira povalilytica]|uniref:hypothetical protein n=1 Tax=Thalassospira povalilytica TaxID=732237 RepID=UPI003AA99178